MLLPQNILWTRQLVYGTHCGCVSRIAKGLHLSAITATYYQRTHEHFKLRRSKKKRELYNQHNDVSRFAQHSATTSSLTDKADRISYSGSMNSYPQTQSASMRKLDYWKGEHVSEETENVFGLHPVMAALETERRSFQTLHMRISIYKQLTDSTVAYPEHPTAFSGILTGIWKKVQALGVPILPVNKSVLDRLATYGVHQGLVLNSSPLKLQQLDSPTIIQDTESGCLWVLINKVFDPMNLGALIRTALYFGVDKILLSPNCSKLSPVVSKASSGAMEFASIYHVTDIVSLVMTVKGNDWDVIGTTCDSIASIPPSKLAKRKNTLVVVGNEGHGIDEEVLELCTTLVTIPMSEQCSSTVDSLNVAVATGVILNQLQNNS